MSDLSNLADETLSPNNRNAQEPALAARAASVDDIAAFLSIARQYAAERYPGIPFEPHVATHLFAGIGRGDPFVFLLLAGAEAVGFATLRMRTLGFSNEIVAYMDTTFIRADRVSEAAEAELLAAVHAMILEVNPREARLVIDAPSPHSMRIYDRLAASGYEAAGVLVSCFRAPQERKVDPPPSQPTEAPPAPSLH